MAGMLSRQSGMGEAGGGKLGGGQGGGDLSPQFRIPHSPLPIPNYPPTKTPPPPLPPPSSGTSGQPPPRAPRETACPHPLMIAATLESLTVHDTCRPERTFPCASCSVAKNVALSPAATLSVAGVTVTVATESGGGGGAESLTMSCAEPLLPSLVAVMSANPAPEVRITTV